MDQENGVFLAEEDRSTLREREERRNETSIRMFEIVKFYYFYLIAEFKCGFNRGMKFKCENG